MSTGAVIVTTDAGPMNEFIQDKRCLVKYSNTNKQNLANLYKISNNELYKTMINLLELSPNELEEIGKLNRQRYLEQRKEFLIRLKKLMESAEEILK